LASIAFAFNRDSAAQLRASHDVQIAKRTVDIVGSLIALILLAPLLCVVGLLICVVDPGPVIYAQERVGKAGRLFRCLKFRTMLMNADEILERVLESDLAARAEWQRLHKLRRDPRVTKFGRFLRMSSIDELPQLLNVLKGDMSLVGPRPVVLDESYMYGHRFRNYCMVKPGLTGLWQVNGRNNTTYRRRVALDVIYSRRMSLAFDFRILCRTIPVILRGEGC
jgi:exopolysaccharide production protein ExoY